MTPEKLKNLTSQPGVYQMLDKQGMVIYVASLAPHVRMDKGQKIGNFYALYHDKNRLLDACH
jgi:hypothetical protein